ncbi:MAG: ribosomal protection-like ABC-F family protein [Christensenellaceae bacterium]|jgi:ATP-binding cassette subfamily F protein 3
MELLTGSHISKSFVLQSVLQDVSFSVEAGDKIGVMGVNGAGKTTLFRIIAGEIEADEGFLQKIGNPNIAYMPQHAAYTSERTATEEVMEVFTELVEMEETLAFLQREMEENPVTEVIEKYSALYERFTAQEGLTYRALVRSTLLGLGLTEEELLLSLSALSGGQRTRVLLARILLSKPDVLLLDEPTNHLDISAIEWLENFLAGFRGTVLVISHDRYFLDTFITKVFEIERQGLAAYKGNYSDFSRQKEEILLAKERDYIKKSRELKRVEAIVAEQKRWNTERSHITARHKQKMAGRIAAEIEKPDAALKTMRFSLSSAMRSGNDVLLARDVSMRFENTVLFQNVGVDIKRAEKAFLLGDNGIGKTTFFRIITGEISPTAGEIIYGTNVSIGYYSQAQENLPLNKSIVDAVYAMTEEREIGRIRSVLALFLFQGDDIYKEVGALSGGERARVALAILMLAKHNLLLLDEPTNHLDIPSREILEEALLNYDGTIFAVSHDRYFIQKLATHIFELTRTGMEDYKGDYAYYLSEKKKRASLRLAESFAAEKEENAAGNEYREARRMESEKRKMAGQIKRAEEAISRKEASIREKTTRLSMPEVAADYESIVALTEEIGKEEAELAVLYHEWEALMQKTEH